MTRILPDGTRKRATLFSGLLSQYVIEDRYGRLGKGNDKGAVEGIVGWSRRNFMVPLPRFATWDEFNAWLEEQCRKRLANVLRGHGETIGQRLQRDLTAMMPLPPAPFEACDQATGRVSSQALVRYRSSSVKALKLLRSHHAHVPASWKNALAEFRNNFPQDWDEDRAAQSEAPAPLGPEDDDDVITS